MQEAGIAPLQHHANTRYALTELAALALEIQAAEGLDLDTALDRAARELDLLKYYQVEWDNSAVNVGNWDASAGAIPF